MQALLEEWEKLDLELVNKLCLSMPKRLEAVIAAESGITKYWLDMIAHSDFYYTL